MMRWHVQIPSLLSLHGSFDAVHCSPACDGLIDPPMAVVCMQIRGIGQWHGFVVPGPTRMVPRQAERMPTLLLTRHY